MRKATLFVVVAVVAVGTIGWYATSVSASRGAARYRNMPRATEVARYRNMPRGKGYGYTQMVETKAEVLGMSVEELEKELAAGKTFSAIASEKGIAPEEFIEKRLLAQRERLDKLVKAGAITPEQLEERMEFLKERYESCECDENCDRTRNRYFAKDRMELNQERRGRGLGMRGMRGIR